MGFMTISCLDSQGISFDLSQDSKKNLNWLKSNFNDGKKLDMQNYRHLGFREITQVSRANWSRAGQRLQDVTPSSSLCGGQLGLLSSRGLVIGYLLLEEDRQEENNLSRLSLKSTRRMFLMFVYLIPMCTPFLSWSQFIINEHCLPYLQCKWIWAFLWSNPKVLFLFSPKFNKNNFPRQSLISCPSYSGGEQSFLRYLPYLQQQWFSNFAGCWRINLSPPCL